MLIILLVGNNKQYKSTLHNRGNEVINGTTYLTIACSQEPALLDWDETIEQGL